MGYSKEFQRMLMGSTKKKKEEEDIAPVLTQSDFEDYGYSKEFKSALTGGNGVNGKTLLERMFGEKTVQSAPIGMDRRTGMEFDSALSSTYDALVAKQNAGEDFAEELKAYQTAYDDYYGYFSEDNLDRLLKEAQKQRDAKAKDPEWLKAAVALEQNLYSPDAFQYKEAVDKHQKELDEIKAWEQTLRQDKQSAKYIQYMTLAGKEDFEQYSTKATPMNDFVREMEGVEGAERKDAVSNLSEDELSVYNYLYNKEGRKKADEFYEFLKGYDLNRRQAVAKAKHIQDMGFLGETTMSVGTNFGAGVQDWAGGMKSLFTGDPAEQSASQIAAAILTEEAGPVASKVYGASRTVGNMAPSILLSKGLGTVSGALGASANVASKIGQTAGAVSMGTSAAGNAYSQKIAEGWEEKDARTYGLLVGASEVATERIFNGIPGLGGAIDADDFVRTLNGSFSRLVAGGVINMAGEVAEEELQLLLEPAIEKMVVGGEYKTPTGKEALDTALVTMLSTGAMNAPGAIGLEINYNKYGKMVQEQHGWKELADRAQKLGAGTTSAKIAEKISAEPYNVSYSDIGRLYTQMHQDGIFEKLTENEQKVVDAIFAKETEGKDLSKKEQQKLREEIVREMDEGNITADYIESVLGGDEYTALQETLKSENEALQELSGLYKGEELDAEVKKFIENSESRKLKAQLRENVSGMVKGERLYESYREIGRATQKFTADVSKYNEKYRATIQRAIDSGSVNNSRYAHRMVETVAKFEHHLGAQFDFSNTKKINEAGYGIEGKITDGYVDENGNITINMQSPKVWNFIVGHEITHLAQDTKFGDKLNEMLFEYAKGRKAKDSKFENEYMERLYDVRQRYKNIQSYQGTEGLKKIKREVAADLVGDYLFNDREFVEHLAKDRNLFQWLWNDIKRMANIMTAGSEEAKQLERIKKTFEDAYRKAGEGGTKNNATSGVKYLIREDIVDVNGKEYNSVVELDKTVSKRTMSEPKKFMRYIVNNLVGLEIPVIDGDGNTEVIEFAGEGETVTKTKGRHPVLGELAYAKGDTRKQVIVNAEEVIQESVYDPEYSSTDNEHGWLDRNGWESRKTYVLTKDGMIYEAYLKIAKAEDGRNILYAVNLDINKGIAVDQGATSKKAAVLAAMPSADKLAQESKKVKGTFSVSEYAPTFYSNMERVAEGVKQEKLGAASVVSMLRGKGVKAEEIKWSGIETWLEGKKSVTKQELLEFMRANRIDVQEKVRDNKKDDAVFKRLSPTTKGLFVDGKLVETYLSKIGDRGYVAEMNDPDNYFPESWVLEKHSHRSTKWGEYKLDGGKNYREVEFVLPDSTYSNGAMQTHWGKDAQGVIAHARVQDFKDGGKKMLFIEEIQSDWHNEGHKKGYDIAGEGKTDIRNKSGDAYRAFVQSDVMRSVESRLWRSDYNGDVTTLLSDLFDGNKGAYSDVLANIELSKEERTFIDKAVSEEAKRQEQIANAPENTGVPDAPFKENYHEFVLKRLLRQAAENGYASIGWTTADTQSARWSDKYAEGYRIEYDQDIPKFLNKYGKQWGAKVGKTTLRNGTEVWTMPITDAMKQSVLYEGQPQYSVSDADYADAVNRGDMATVQKMVDEAAVEWGAYLNTPEANEVFKQDGEVRVFYHGTNTGDFTSFDNRLLGSSSGDLGWFGKGFYFAFSYDEAAAYGRRVIPAYLKMHNPFDYSQLYKFKGSDKGASQYSRFAWLYNITRNFPDIVKGQRVWAYPNDAEQGSSISWEQLANWMDGIQREKQFSVEKVDLNNGDTAYELRADPKKESYTNDDGETFEWTEYGMTQLFATEKDAREPINQVGAYLQNVFGIDSIPRKAIESIDFSGALQRAGYDGILQSMSGDEAVVFSPEQIKSSEPVTYDDNGNVIPLSERFNSKNADIRFSISDPGETAELPIRGSYNVPAKYLAYDPDAEPDLGFAPVRKDVGTVAENATVDDVAPVAEDEGEFLERLESLTDEDAPPLGKIRTVRDRLEAKMQNFQTELNENKRHREESIISYNEEIERLKGEYNATKNKNTKKANDLLRRIERTERMKGNVDADYAKRISDLEGRVQKTSEELRSGQSPTEQKAMRTELHQSIVDKVKARFAAGGYDFDSVLKNAKNLSTFSTVDNIPQRVMEKSLGYKEGQILSDMTVDQVARNETEGIKWLNSFTDRKNGVLANLSKKYGIKPGSKESAASQMYAEGFYVAENNDIIEYGDAELAKDFPDAKVRNNIKGLARDPAIRQIYDETLAAINESRTRNAYPEIQKLDNYFLHFRAMDDTFSRLGLPFNPNDIRAKDLPTDLNGVTADLKPGQPYFASAMHRTGKRTSFDLLGGLEKYLTSAKNQIYHIDDIQTLRALRNYIADTYGQANGLEGLDTLTEEEAQERIEKVYGSHLSTFAKFLNEEANVIAGKTALIDRGLEGIIGRRGITFLGTVNKQVGANMVGFNISSSLTNFLAPVQAFAKTNKAAFVKGFAQTVQSKLSSIVGKTDAFVENNPTIIRRKGADSFYRTPFQKVGDAGYLLMSAVDNISTEIIVRAKYNELIQKGMSHDDAIVEADKWTSRLMGDRSLGQQPHLYNSKMLGILTKFQLEVRNQLDSQFYDTIKEAQVSNEDIQNAKARNAKTAAKVASTFFQLAVAQHLFGKAFESIAGYNPAFDIISVLATAFGWDDEEDSEDTALDNIEQGFMELLEDLPYTSTFTGGRIPIQSALPVEQLIKGEDQYGNEKSRWETLGEIAPYYALPGGYGQIKKTVAGLKMFSDDHPVSGSYTDSGNLRFPVEETPLNVAQAAIFGQYASENAREYFDRDLAPLNPKQIQEYIDVDLPISEYWDYRQGLKGLDKLEEKADYIDSLDLPIGKKNILINNIADRKEPIDMEDYGQYGSMAEFDYAEKNPEKYSFLKENGISYNEYKSFDDDTKDAWDWGYENPEKMSMAKAIAGDVVGYRQHTADLNDIKADKDSDGKTISGSRKEKVIEYLNGLDMDYGQKIILYRSQYSSQEDRDMYNAEIVEYLNSREDLSYEEIVDILKGLDFTVTSDGNVYWD